MSIGNPFDAIRAAVQEARDINRAADQQASSLAELLCGRLRNVRPMLLVALKRELREFNAHTGVWSEDR